MRGLLLAAVLGLARPPAAAAEDGLRRTVVKIFTTSQRPNFYQPWQRNAQESSLEVATWMLR